jgi:lipoate-protein ligase B
MRLRVADLGLVSYAEALALQRSLASCLIEGTLKEDMLLLLEHPAVVTLGRSAKDTNVLLTRDALAARGIEMFEAERGGDVTFHGPGQLVGYPIIDLRRHREDLHWYLRQLEAALIAALRAIGVATEISTGQTGVWTGDRKIASIGIHARQWVAWHGFALNVTTDLAFFDVIVACGIDGVRMTSVANELALSGAGPSDAAELRRRASNAVIAAFADTFGLDVVHDEELRSRCARVARLP